MSSPRVVINDYKAARCYQILGSSTRWKIVETTPTVLAEHAGTLRLDTQHNTSWAHVDDQRGELVIETDVTRHTYPVATPAEHLAGDSSARYLAISTGLGANWAAWSEVVTVIDRRRNHLARFRTQVGEPGVAIVPDATTNEQTLVLRHREPGAIEVIPVAAAMSAGPHVPKLEGNRCELVADDGHGDLTDTDNSIFATATSRGLERFLIRDGRAHPLPTWPWPLSGRAYYLRFDTDSGCALGIVRGGAADPSQWTTWTNHLVSINLLTGATHSTDLPQGLAFRFGWGGGVAALTTIHPDGDRLQSFRHSDSGWQPLLDVGIAPMTQPPAAGHMPWDAVGDKPAQRRAVAVSESGDLIAFTQGGDGLLHLISDFELPQKDTAPRHEIIALPSPLNEGGHLYCPHADRPSPSGDLIGR